VRRMLPPGVRVAIPHMLWRFVEGVLFGLGLVFLGNLAAPIRSGQAITVAMTRVVAPVAVGHAVGEAAGATGAGISLALMANNVIALLFMALGGLFLARITERRPPGPVSRAIYRLGAYVDPGLDDVTDEDQDTYFLLFLFPGGGMALNGAVAGMLLGLAGLTGLDGLYALVRYVLPHAIVELPVLVIGASVGYAIACEVLTVMDSSGDVDSAVRRVHRPYVRLLGVLCTALVVAGVVEAYLIV